MSVEPNPLPVGVPVPIPPPDDDRDLDRPVVAAALRAARETNLADIAQAEAFLPLADAIMDEADQVAAASTNPAIDTLASHTKQLAQGAKVMASHSKAQAQQLNGLIRLLVWQLRKSDSSL